jgi:hypothetical protein
MEITLMRTRKGFFLHRQNTRANYDCAGCKGREANPGVGWDITNKRSCYAVG